MKPIFFILGWISFILGFIGAFVPILPTTPFLILSAFLFSKSSPRFHAWILSLPFAGEAIKDWRANRVIKPKAKVLCVSMISASVFSLWYFSTIQSSFKILVTLIVGSLALYVLTRSNGPKA